jgi:cobalt-precorrin-7 (C5)-methyltransferase
VDLKEHKITIIGCGPGSPDYITAAGLRAVEEAEVLVGAARLLRDFGVEGADRIKVGGDIAAALDEIDAVRNKRRVAVLVTGDPGLSSLARPVIRRFGREKCRVIPGVSSVQTAFARLGLDWLGAEIITAHGRRPDIDVGYLAGCDKIAVLAGEGGGLEWAGDVATALGSGYLTYLCQDLTLENERVEQVDAGRLTALPRSPRTVVIFIKEALLA